MRYFIPIIFVCAFVLSTLLVELEGGWVADDKQPFVLQLHTVSVPIKSYRLLSMSMDDDGFIWVGSIHQTFHRYDPRKGTIRIPYKATVNACLCVCKKVYLLGQTYPRLIVYNRTTGKFNEFPYPSPKPNIWYGNAAEGRYLYLFDRGSAGVIKWDTQSDKGKVNPWPYKTRVPSLGHYEAQDLALGYGVWNYAGGKYVPVGIARLDVKNDRFHRLVSVSQK